MYNYSLILGNLYFISLYHEAYLIFILVIPAIPHGCTNNISG